VIKRSEEYNISQQISKLMLAKKEASVGKRSNNRLYFLDEMDLPRKKDEDAQTAPKRRVSLGGH
jgi:hypothetical protein